MSRAAGPPFDRVLIANRGEIAVRIVRACRELGIVPIAVYGDGEERAPHVRLAAESHRIPSGDGLPYLDVEALVGIARTAGVQAVHPGYGFLAENATFAVACTAAGLTFVGPPAAAIRAMGDKVAARRIAVDAGVPVVPGSDGPIDSPEAARAWAAANGDPYPLAIKAAGGGGGRGFRVARDAASLTEAFTGAAGEAQRSFANPVVYIERYLERPRHVEAQIFADRRGNVLFLGERDCSVQRRHQKLIEETPSPAVTPAIRQKLADAALSLARAVNYEGAGTVEFMLDERGEVYFLEMNTRIQVEHTVTEMVTGLDLVADQFRVAAGDVLSRTELEPRGHAIECRINAEDAGRDFAPAPGTITAYREPAGFGVRVDAAMEPGAEILPDYDSLIAKVVTWGRDRHEAIARMQRALGEFTIAGVPTTIPFHQAVLAHAAFRDGEATTTFLTDYPDVLPAPSGTNAAESETEQAAPRQMIAEVNGRRFTVRLYDDTNRSAPSRRRPPRGTANRRGKQTGASVDGQELTSPIHGTVLRVAVEPGQAVSQGEVIAVVEAMKMENELTAHRDGTVTALRVAVGDAVRIGDIVATIEAPSDGNATTPVAGGAA